MKRHLLAAAVASAPLLAAAAPALAQVTISNSTNTPVQTATANNGAPSDVIVSGSIGLTTAGTATTPINALTLNSNNNVNITGSLGSTSLDYTGGLDILGGYTGSAVNQGTINITESYTPPTDPNNDGLYTGAFAQGSNRVGLEVTGSGVFTGNNQTVSTANGNITVNGVTNLGTITVNGNDSYGVLIAAPIVGNYMSLSVIPATSATTSPTGSIGTITVVGQDSVGFEIAPGGAIDCAASGCSKGDGVGGAGASGNLRIGVTSATGPGAQGVVLNGSVGGSVNVEGSVTATGYRTTTRQTNPFIAIIYSQMEMQQGGAAMTVGGSIGGGLIISAPPTILNTTDNSADLDNDGVPDVLQGTGSVLSYGSAPAMQIGSATGNPITIGAYTGSSYVSQYNGASVAPSGFGLVIQGSVLGESLFDQLTSPYLLKPVSATALQIGGPILITPEIYTYNSNNQPTSTTPTAAVYGTSGTVNIVGGVYNRGTIAAYAYQADATAIHVGYNATVPTIYNDGTIYASSTQVNSALTPTPNSGGYPTTPTPVAVNVVAIQIGDPTTTPNPAGTAPASVTTITNNSGILAELTGTGGVGGTTKAIVDYTGSLQNINNSGSIEALLNQTSVANLMPTSIAPLAATAVAIDMHYGTTAQTITQTAVTLPSSIPVTAYVATSSYATLNTVVTYLGNIYRNVAEASPGYDPIDYPQYWQEIGAVSPSITGDIYMGSGNDTLNISAGTVSAANITMGAGVNTINVEGSGVTNTLGDTGFVNVTGAISEQAGGAFVINVNHGQLNDLNPQLGQAAKSITVGSTGILEVTADPLHSQNTQFVISGSTPNSATIASGGQIGLIMASLQTTTTPQSYTIMYGAPGTISAPSLSQTALGFTPYLYTATASFIASAPASSAPGAAPAGDNEINLTVNLKTPAQMGFNAAEAAAFDPALVSLQKNSTATNLNIQQALLAQTTQAGLKSVYDQLLPNQGQGIFEALDAAVEKVSALTATPPDNATHIGASSMWLQEVNERVQRTGIDTLGSDAQALGLVGGYERMGAAGGAVGVTLAYFNISENDSAAQLGAHDLASLVEASVYYRRSIGALTLSARAGGGYGWFSDERVFAYGTTLEQAQANWTGAFVDGHLGASYEIKLFGPYYARPEVSIDYLRLAQGGYQEHGPDSAFNLAVEAQTDTQFTGQAIMTLGRQWGRASWLRTEVRFGYRAVIDGTVGDTTANFLNGTPFTLVGDPDKGGWATVGFSLKTGSEFSYLALEGDADLRRGEQRYDLRVAGRSVF